MYGACGAEYRLFVWWFAKMMATRSDACHTGLRRSLQKSVVAASYGGSFRRDQDLLFLSEHSRNQSRNAGILLAGLC